MLSVGSIYAFSTFVKPISNHMGFTLQQVQFAFSLCIFFLGMGACCLGNFVEKDVRKSAILGGTLFSVGLIVTAVAINYKSLTMLYIGYGVLTGTGCGVCYLTPVKTVILWMKKREGLASGIVIMSFGFASTIASPLNVFLMNRFGLELTFIILGTIYFTFIILGSILIKKPYEEKILKQNKVSLKFVLKDKWFVITWLIMYLNILCGITLISVASPILQDYGYSLTFATMIVGLMGFTNGIGRIVCASLSDRLYRRIDMYTFMISIAIVLVFFVGINNSILPLMLLLIPIVYGMGFSTLPLLIKDRTGTDGLSSVHGKLLSAWAMAGITSTLLIPIYNSGLENLLLLLCVLYVIVLKLTFSNVFGKNVI